MSLYLTKIEREYLDEVLGKNTYVFHPKENFDAYRNEVLKGILNKLYKLRLQKKDITKEGD